MNIQSLVKSLAALLSSAPGQATVPSAIPPRPTQVPISVPASTISHPPSSFGLALQGGGALGAFTWGVLDRLLEESSLPPLHLSGSSAGAVNACVFACHLTLGGRQGARDALARVWRRISAAGHLTPQGARPGWLPAGGSGSALGADALSSVLRMLSPSQFNPLNLNPLRGILEEEIDFAALRHPSCPRILVAATRIRDGACRLFDNDTLTLESLLASCTLPQLHLPVVIDGEAYWDGGYSANPPLVALVDEGFVSRVLLVRLIAPDFGSRSPTSVGEIATRLNQIAFSRPLTEELLALEHRSDAPPIDILTLDSRLAARAWTGLGGLDWRYLDRLKIRGHRLTDKWLSEGHFASVLIREPRLPPLSNV